jgi:hypothetical protein
MMELQLKITGGMLVLLSLIHVPFPQRFQWKKELSGISLINRQMMYVHTFFVAFMVLLMGVLCIGCTDDILHTRLGKQLSGGLFLFWVTRLVFQFFVYSPLLWKGKRFETVMHIVFAMLWTYFSIVFLFIYLQ